MYYKQPANLLHITLLKVIWAKLSPICLECVQTSIERFSSVIMQYKMDANVSFEDKLSQTKKMTPSISLVKFEDLEDPLASWKTFTQQDTQQMHRTE